MTQYRIDTHEFWGTNKTIYEVVMLADQYGNRVSSGNPSGMAVASKVSGDDAHASLDWEEISR